MYHNQDATKLSSIILTLSFLLIVAGCGQSSTNDAPESVAGNDLATTDSVAEEAPQHQLTVDLQSGFTEDTVRILINGELISELEAVTTSLLLGIATSVETEADGEIELTIEVPNRSLTKEMTLVVSADTYLGISIFNDEIDIIISDQPFGYG